MGPGLQTVQEPLYSLSPHTCRKGTWQGENRSMFSIKQEKWLTLVNHNCWLDVFSQSYDGIGSMRKALRHRTITYTPVWVATCSSLFITGHHFSLKDSWQQNYYLTIWLFNRCFPRDWIKRAYYFNKNNTHYLLPEIKFEPSSKT